jgi:RNA polymerase sigma-B factor
MDTEALVLEHLPLVDRCARRFRGWDEPVDDLVQAGRIGLLHAARRYDATRGIPFAAYAVPTVLGAMRHHLRDRTSLLAGTRGASTTPRTVELGDPATADAAPAAAFELVEQRVALLPQLACLPRFEQQVLVLRFVDGLSQDAAAAELGVSQAHVSRVQARALARLRRRLGTRP